MHKGHGRKTGGDCFFVADTNYFVNINAHATLLNNMNDLHKKVSQKQFYRDLVFLFMKWAFKPKSKADISVLSYQVFFIKNALYKQNYEFATKWFLPY